jgi:NAD(P)-dependent dehydrogenase (short-subunit alcohol dehydrogenase family)
MSQVVLITGCSTGIGRDLAERLSRAGYTVAASARTMQDLSTLEAALKLELDVTQPESIRRAVDSVVEKFGRIDVLVNNAGYAVRGAVEEVTIEAAQRMFDTNVFGVMRMVQAVAPHMRERKAGRIINISSVVGKLVTPANGTYAATKFAVEALSDALRMELAPFGVQVVVIEPGSIQTRFHATMEANGRRIFANPASPYRSLYRQYEQVDAEMRRGEPAAGEVSKCVQRAIEAEHPSRRYVPGFSLTGRLVLRLGDPVWDVIVRQMFKIPA